MKTLAQTVNVSTEHMTESDREQYFESMYYTDYPSVMSIEEFSSIVNSLSRGM